MNIAYNMDCLAAMREMPDNAFDLAVADPPYGGGFTEGGGCKGWFSKYHQNEDGERKKKIISWDVAPGEDYFKELFRVSRNQIIWGGNYFSLPPTRCFLIWRKLTISENFTMAMAEYAWTSFNSNAKVFEYAPQGRPGEVRNKRDVWVVSTKPYSGAHFAVFPEKLIEPCIMAGSKHGGIVLDPFSGAGTTGVVCKRLGREYIGIELNREYVALSEKRIKDAPEFQEQLSLF